MLSVQINVQGNGAFDKKFTVSILIGFGGKYHSDRIIQNFVNSNCSDNSNKSNFLMIIQQLLPNFLYNLKFQGFWKYNIVI